MTLDWGPNNENIDQKDQLSDAQDLLKSDSKEIAPFVDDQEVKNQEKTNTQARMPIAPDLPMTKSDITKATMLDQNQFSSRWGPKTETIDPIKKAMEEAEKAEKIVAEVLANKWSGKVTQPKVAPQPIAADIPMWQMTKSKEEETSITAKKQSLEPIAADIPMSQMPKIKTDTRTEIKPEQIVASTVKDKNSASSSKESFNNEESLIPLKNRTQHYKNKTDWREYTKIYTDDEIWSTLDMNNWYENSSKESWIQANKEWQDFSSWLKDYMNIDAKSESVEETQKDPRLIVIWLRDFIPKEISAKIINQDWKTYTRNRSDYLYLLDKNPDLVEDTDKFLSRKKDQAIRTLADIDYNKWETMSLADKQEETKDIPDEILAFTENTYDQNWEVNGTRKVTKGEYFNSIDPRKRLNDALANKDAEVIYNWWELAAQNAKEEFIAQKRAESSIMMQKRTEQDEKLRIQQERDLERKRKELADKAIFIEKFNNEKIAEQEAEAARFRNAEIIRLANEQKANDAKITELTTKREWNSPVSWTNVFDPTDTQAIKKAVEAASRNPKPKEALDTPIDFSWKKSIQVWWVDVPIDIYNQFKKNNDTKWFQDQVNAIKESKEETLRIIRGGGDEQVASNK